MPRGPACWRARLLPLDVLPRRRDDAAEDVAADEAGVVGEALAGVASHHAGTAQVLRFRPLRACGVRAVFGNSMASVFDGRALEVQATTTTTSPRFSMSTGRGLANSPCSGGKPSTQ